MKINPTDSALDLIETNVVETFKAGPGNRAYAMIGHQKVLLPSHKDVFPLGKVAIREIRSLGLLGQGSPRRKSIPMEHVHLLGGAPCFMPGLKCVFGSDDFALEECRQCRMVLS